MDARTLTVVRERVEALSRDLDPVRLLRDMRAAQEELVAIADRVGAMAVPSGPPAIEPFLAGLRTAWQAGEVRPTARAEPKAKRGRRRPDPLVEVTAQLRAWFEEAPSQSGRELLERLQAAYPDGYPDGLRRERCSAASRSGAASTPTC